MANPIAATPRPVTIMRTPLFHQHSGQSGVGAHSEQNCGTEPRLTAVEPPRATLLDVVLTN